MPISKRSSIIKRLSERAFGPSASIQILKKRARLLAQLRAYMHNLNVVEADVPVLGQATVTDPFIESLSLEQSPQCFLQTSPEFYLKRLLASGLDDVYYLGPAFRKDEKGHRHRSEFAMLEWYRVGLDDRRLMSEISELFQFLKPSVEIHSLSYQRAFKRVLNICPHEATVDQLRQLAKEKTGAQFDSPLKSVWLNLLFSHCVEPSLTDGVTFVFDFPECLGALARLSLGKDGLTVARRFECYWSGIELANGYWELTDADEQAQRFARDNGQRRQLGLPEVQGDESFLAALQAGLPDCAGVALGVDRLLMCLENLSDIEQVMPFANH